MSDDARAYALRLLAQRSYTAKGLREKLLKKEFPPEEADSALTRFMESGLIDDRKFAQNFARARLTGTSASPRRVRQLLVQKGIASSIADEAIAAIVEDEQIDIDAVLERVARRKLDSLKDEEPIKVRQKLFGFLARRGYDLDDVKKVVAQLTAKAGRGEREN
jgi:regulatory protein